MIVICMGTADGLGLGHGWKGKCRNRLEKRESGVEKKQRRGMEKQFSSLQVTLVSHPIR